MEAELTAALHVVAEVQMEETSVSGLEGLPSLSQPPNLFWT